MYFCSVFLGTRIIFAQLFRRTATSKGIFTSNTCILLELRSKRRFLHKYTEAVAGLAEYMAGLRFLYVLKLVLILLKERN